MSLFFHSQEKGYARLRTLKNGGLKFLCSLHTLIGKGRNRESWAPKGLHLNDFAVLMGVRSHA